MLRISRRIIRLLFYIQYSSCRPDTIFSKRLFFLNFHTKTRTRKWYGTYYSVVCYRYEEERKVTMKRNGTLLSLFWGKNKPGFPENIYGLVFGDQISIDQSNRTCGQPNIRQNYLRISLLIGLTFLQIFCEREKAINKNKFCVYDILTPNESQMVKSLVPGHIGAHCVLPCITTTNNN